MNQTFPISMYGRMFENVTLNETDLADPDFLDNIRIVLGEHSLTLTEDTDVTSQVDKIITHEHFSEPSCLVLLFSCH